MSTPEVITGTVKWFNAEKGFGFITASDGSDLFVHLRALADGRTALAPGEQVHFSVRKTPKGREASNVRVGPPPPPPKPALPTVELLETAPPAQVRMRVVARPAAVRELRQPGEPPGLFAFVADLPPDAAPAPGPGVPARSGTAACLVLLSVKHWRAVRDALDADPQDALIVDGHASLDPLEPGMVTLRATAVTTVALERARRAAWQARKAQEPQDLAQPDAEEVTAVVDYETTDDRR